eukprot:CAMPEP_0177514794 /NCGR_PEP_ID=MMETSP0369-20130122/44511_1 /TAXON_ID=447022 ORGANISM="Scrippsiella hangoei-like, Strain SHHI-4" /NCGR_SAMPLE_ID=MMETSP0369 /ASSEMBLY_ACC=CAM_ASM_000364 /LENGTH=61 /DNA_ID=CAMNT_0018993517 /DNA_START=74 /DNA_END=256 /DNA_ORIENTATION=-
MAQSPAASSSRSSLLVPAASLVSLSESGSESESYYSDAKSERVQSPRVKGVEAERAVEAQL